MKLFFGQIFPEILIDSDEQQHIAKVLRMREGEEIYLTDGKGNLAKGTLIFEGKKVTLNVSEVKENLPDFSPKLHIAIAPTKNIDRIEFFLEKAVEMGISEVSFILTEQTERKNISIDKLKKQAISASKQSLRSHFPKINDLQKFSEFMKNLNPENTFVAHCNENLERINLNALREPQHDNFETYTFLIGPEGDFSDKEIHQLAEKGVKAVSLGNQRLRTETAGIFVAAWNYDKMF
ncbi:RsmE family RNA methyltransferase [Epilithonimonas ginsengisoli]|uniref:Ribosomal RNA small subunit methyltransferase E n=1 Tax=Epilithonimonas ginsengisoli TaxID=1245592 RepID=A0ABU4JFG4_9FLAO|nr:MULTISPECIES: RsmE family RNA methyltransferase [Chryseobacterium group]MBV6879782.1 16S rRNA (uracil(1498)-N(3))-methyltransferase [Epilithonimonas sp. FP105]MDW8548421.1 RsmE family RNA methyltransferase [Epilithonimonas ginsengisoli]OAH75784.1 rRNA methyltransferase [Chryseobacterium sp. FP211-J200]